jgi:hypothetical protein
MENEEKKEVHKHHELHLTINEKKFPWHPQYITGAEIRKLGEIPTSDELYLKVKEGWENELITDDRKIDLAAPGMDHFFSKKPGFIIVVNLRDKQWLEKLISYDQVVNLAFPDYNPNNPNIVYTVTYKKGPHQNPEGSMSKGVTVYVKDKMIFNVSKTDKS